MVFLSKLLSRAVRDSENRRIGQVSDIVVSMAGVFPTITALAVSQRTGRLPRGNVVFIPWVHVTNLEEDPIYLNVPASALNKYEPAPGDVYLGRDVLDKQIVDTQGRRIVKVNDLKLGQIQGVGHLIGADISLRAFLRRLGAEKTADLLARILPINLPERLITWNFVEPLEAEASTVRLTIPQTQLADLHPADIADVLEQLEPEERVALFGTLEDVLAADTLEEFEPDYQASMLQAVGDERASSILDKMPPDEVADILGDLPDEQAEHLLSLMDQVEAEDVRKLLRYPEDSAGGIMTTEVFSLPSSLTAEEAVSRLRGSSLGSHATYYLYVVDGDGHLAGVLSLRDLVTAPADAPLSSIMDENVIKATVEEDQAEVARIIAKYDLLALPIVDESNTLCGMVTVDDVIDVIEEEASEEISQVAGTTVEEVAGKRPLLDIARDRMAWLVVTTVGGLVAALVMRGYAPVLRDNLRLAYFLPLLLTLGTGVAVQALAATSRAVNRSFIYRFLQRELAVTLAFGAVAGAILMAAISLSFHRPGLGVAVGASIVGTLLVSATLGALLAIVLGRPKTALGPILRPIMDPLIGVLSVLLYLSIASLVLGRFA